uniref:Nicastrin n=1 Tax=Oryzias latipes TaxID=8090 RepID=H2LCL9_ORYLA
MEHFLNFNVITFLLQNLNETFPCVRLLNATHQIGCQSSFGGDVGVVHLLESEENLDWVLSSGPNPPYMVILESTLFTRYSQCSRVAGVVVVEPTTNPPDGFSPHTSCPNENMGVYSESYGPSYAHCNVTVWNPLGNGLSYEEFDFPIFSMKDSNDTEVIRRCYREHNRAVNGSTPQYPLCAMQLFSHMSAVTDTATCMRRSEIPFSLTPEFVCDPLGDENIWASTKPLNNTAKGHKEGESVVIAAVKMDSRSFFFGLAPGADSTATGLVALLAAANALRNATAELNRTILYTFFHGETFDYIGSSRMVYDMENNQFPLDLDNVHSILEVGQVALGSNSRLWLHSDPVSRRNRSVNKLVSNLHLAAAGLNISLEEPNVTQPLPPSSFQRFLRVRSIPGVVIENHQASFTNKYYQSIFDNAESLQLNYSPNLTAEEQLEFVTDAAKNLTEVATAVARGLYLQAGGHPAGMNTVQADSKLVRPLDWKRNSGYTWIKRLKIKKQSSDGDVSTFSSEDKPTKFYIGVDQEMSEPNFMVQTILANLTGTIVNVTKENCQKQKEDEEDNRNKHLYYYQWVQGPLRPNSTERDSFCVRSTVRKSPAKSPAFVLREYTSKDYSTWTESRWKTITGRIFLVASHDLEMLTLGVGVAVLLVSLLLTYFVSSKADILFSSGREPTNATY